MPTLCSSAFMMLTLSLSPGSTPLDHPLPVAGTDHMLQYDDGSAHWLTWDGLYRGVWFDLEDFTPGAGSVLLAECELWFYHHSNFPWDTSFFFAELYNGGSAGPERQLDQTSVTAVHYAPCYVQYPSPILAESLFWGLANTSMSAGGWPSMLGDNTPQSVSHSFLSHDLVIWAPWIVQGPTANDLFVRFSMWAIGLERTTWGEIKTMY